MRLARGLLVPKRLVVAMGMALLMVASLAQATDGLDATPIGVDIRISGAGAVRDEQYPAIAWNQTANEYLVVWVDYRSIWTDRGADIFGRRVGANGVAIGADFRISASNTDEYQPAVVWNATTNEYLVVWEDDRSGGPRGYELYGRRVGANGVVIGTSFRVSNSIADEYGPDLVWNGTANQYLVVWVDMRGVATRGYEIYGRRVAADGTPMGVADFRVSNSVSHESYPAVAWSQTADQYLVVWTDTRSRATRDDEIYGRRLDGAGAPVGGNFRISSSTAEEHHPDVVWNQTTNQYLVVWQDGRTEATYEIYGRRVSAAGMRVGVDRLLSDATTEARDPQVAWNGTANQYFVVWSTYALDKVFGIDIYGRRVDGVGTPAGAGVRLNTPTAVGRDNPVVAWNATANQYLVAWQDGRSDTRGWEIYGRRVTGDPAGP